LSDSGSVKTKPGSYLDMSPATFHRLVNLMRGKRYLVLQVENRVYLQADAPLVESNFVPSIIAMSRWAKKNDYAYLLYLPPARAKDPWKQSVISHYWHKVPGMILAHRIAQAAGLLGVLYVDTDVSPDYLPIHNPRQNSSTTKCTPRIEEDISTEKFPMRNLTTLEAFFETIERRMGTSMENSMFHFVLPPGHSTAQRWMTGTLKYPKHIPIINAGVMYFRTTNTTMERLEYWYLESIRKLSALEVAAAVGKFKVKNVTRSQYDAIVATNKLNFTQFKPLQDIYDFSMCTPIFRIAYENNSTIEGSFQCRGKSAAMLRTFWDDICKPKRLLEIFRLSPNNTNTSTKCTQKPHIHKHIRHWPGDQGRFQEMVLDDWGRNGSDYYIPKNPALSSVRTTTGHLLYHWNGSKGKIDAGGRLNQYLMEQTFPDKCVLSLDEWAKYAWREVKSLPSFRISPALTKLDFPSKQKLIFDYKSPDCEHQGAVCYGKYLDVLNVPE